MSLSCPWRLNVLSPVHHLSSAASLAVVSSSRDPLTVFAFASYDVNVLNALNVSLICCRALTGGMLVIIFR